MRYLLHVGAVLLLASATPLSVSAREGPAHRQGVEKSGRFETRLRPDRTVISVTVIQSTGYRHLDRAAAEALLKWRFDKVPPHVNKVRVPVTFR